MSDFNNTIDSFDLEGLRLTQDYESLAGVKKIITTVPVRKPHSQWFIRTRPGEAWRVNVAILELKDERESYVVIPSLYSELANEVTSKTLYLAMNRSGDVFLLPVKLPGSDGRLDNWNRSLATAVEMAETRWLRICSNLTMGCYEMYEATGAIPEPVWPEDMTFQSLVETAFRGRIITGLDHPIIVALRGGV
jgi:hypothetical protein